MKTKYSDLIEIRESAIAFKIHPENGDWRDFIPNGQFNDVLRKVTNAVYNNNADFHKPFWIAGTYGSGKSHAGAVLKHLLCDKVEDIREYVEREYKDDSLALLRSDILNLRSKKRLFPVSLYSNENMAAAEDLPFVLQRVIVDALKAAGIEFEVQTDFDNYINDINKDSEFWSLVIDRDAQLKALAPTTDVLIDKLHDCGTSVIRHIKNALRKQNRVVPLHSDSLEDWIFEVQDKLAAQGVYDGLLILWDEFTDVIKSSFGLSILVTLQGISERMMMAKNNSYFLFISHPSALDNLQVEEREKTKGRYHYMPYNMETVSAYKIMSRKFKFDEDDVYYKHKRSAFVGPHEKLYKEFATISTSNSPEETEQDLYNLFPIHPGTANLATYYAREAGSSSRSVFEFIGANPKIREFFENEEAYADGRVITANFLWDFVVDEFNEKVSKFGAVTERFNSRKLQVENEGGPECYAVFKSILLLNALNNIANNITVTPSEENIARLFVGTHIEPKLKDILDYLNDNSIIQRAPGGLFSIQFSSLPTKEIEAKKNELKLTQFKYTSSIINFGSEADKLLKMNFSTVTRPMTYQKYSIDNNEYLLLNAIEKGRKNCPAYEIFVALLFARNAQELSELKQIAYNATSNDEIGRFDSTLFVVYETPFGDTNYERFIEYQANASVARSHNSTEQAETHIASANAMIKEWVQKLQRATFSYFLRDQNSVSSGLKIALTINSCVAPTIFSSGPDSYDLLRSKSATYWRKQLARDTVKTVLTNNTKTDISSRCTGQYAHMALLLQDSVDENLEWKPSISPLHPLKLVADFIDKKLHSVNKNTDFNLGERLKELTLPPFGLFQSCACMGMVAFAMRKYVKQIFDTNGKPLDATHIADAVIKMFQAWESDKVNNTLNFMFETKESGELCRLFVQNFRLNELKGYNDISSLTDARWALTHEYITEKGFPLWSLKHATNFDNLRGLIDNICKISTEKDFRNQPHLMSQTLAEIKQFKFELKELLKHTNAFKEGFSAFVMGVAIEKGLPLKEDEVDEAIAGMRKHLGGDIGYWSEEEARNAYVIWKAQLLEEKRRRQEEELRRQEEEIRRQQANDMRTEYTALEIDKLNQRKAAAIAKVKQIKDADIAKAILEKIIEKTNNSLVISLINEYDA